MEGQGWCGAWPVAGGSCGDVTMARTQGCEVVQPAGALEDKIRESWGYQAGFPGGSGQQDLEGVGDKRDNERERGEIGRKEHQWDWAHSCRVAFCVGMVVPVPRGRLGHSKAAQRAGALELEQKSGASPATRCPHCPALWNSGVFVLFCFWSSGDNRGNDITISISEVFVTENFLRAPYNKPFSQTFLLQF